MNKLTQLPRNLLNRAQRRFVRSRPGSVLILVIALLVLMALIGTAYVTMAQFDRVSAQQHSFNTQVDLLLDGVINLAKGVVTGELTIGGNYRPNDPRFSNVDGTGMDAQAANLIVNGGGFASPGTPFLADRIPSVTTPGVGANATNNVPFWRFITAPLTGTLYESPYWPVVGKYAYFSRDLPTATDPNSIFPAASNGPGLNARWIPTQVQLASGTFPAFQMIDSAGAAVGQPILAADTDADGMADAALFKLPVGTIDGITYYAAVRIIDNAAALNANTASYPNNATPPYLLGDFFPTNVNLDWLLYQSEQPNVGDSINALLNYRLGNPPVPGNAPNDAAPAFANLPALFPVGDNRAARNDFSFHLPYDLLWNQLGRRLNNPGYLPVVNPGAAKASTRLLALPITESVSLARNFILHDPSTSGAAYSPSLLERMLPDSLVNTAPSSPYEPNSAIAWFNQNFTFPYVTTGNNPLPQTPNLVPIRSVLVTQNPVTNFAPNKFRVHPGNIPLAANATTVPQGTVPFVYGDMVTINGRAYVYIFPVPSASPPSPYQQGAQFYWVPEPWSTAPTKISATTGTFGQLMMAYWNVMSDPTNQKIDPVISTPQVPWPWLVARGTEQRQFYSPLRDPWEAYSAGTPATPRVARPAINTQDAIVPTSEVIKLRAALAAVNTMDLRNHSANTGTAQSFNVTSQRLLLNVMARTKHGAGALSPMLAEATVYGTQPQPYIVAVYAENDNKTSGSTPTGGGAAGGGGGGGAGAPGVNPQGYVGVELYNPYPFDISLANWNLGIVVGRSQSTAGTVAHPNMQIQPLTPAMPPTPQLFPGFTSTAVVPHNGYLILENFNSGGGTVMPSPDDAVYRPGILTAATPPAGPNAPMVNYAYVPTLSHVMQNPGSPDSQPGGELVLLRPRQATLTPGGGTPGASGVLACTQLLHNLPEFDEANLYDLVPVDSFDFDGLSLSDGTNFNGIYYSRQQDPNNNNVSSPNNWKFIYPGRWDPTLSTAPAAGGGGGGGMPAAGTVINYQEGLVQASWKSPNSDAMPDVPFTKPVVPWGTPTPATYNNPFLPIQLNNVGFGGPFPAGQSGNQFPLGAFARNGDLLQVPYIGAYRLRLLNNPGALPNTVLELNPVTWDSQQADDYDSWPVPGGTSDDMLENIGRFTPIDGGDLPGNPSFNDFAPAPVIPGNPYPFSPLWHYHWAMSLLDYLTVQSPQDDQFPNADPESYPVGGANQFAMEGVHHSLPGALAPQSYGVVVAGTPMGINNALITMNAVPPANSCIMFLSANVQGTRNLNGGEIRLIGGVTIPPNTPNRAAISFAAGSAALPTAPKAGDVFVVLAPPEETASVNGLVNVNTAPWPVLASVPWIPNAGGPPGTAIAGSRTVALNRMIGFSIAYYRDVDDGTGPPNALHGHGPFKSLFELNKVPIMGTTITNGRYVPLGFTFRDALGQGNGTSRTADFGYLEGDLSPGSPTNPTGIDHVTGDYEGTFLMMTRASNLVTTRSDSYTAYVLVQGWRNAETSNPQLVVQRRAALIIDRSSVTPLNKSPNTVNVPMN